MKQFYLSKRGVKRHFIYDSGSSGYLQMENNQAVRWFSQEMMETVCQLALSKTTHKGIPLYELSPNFSLSRTHKAYREVNPV